MGGQRGSASARSNLASMYAKVSASPAAPPRRQHRLGAGGGAAPPFRELTRAELERRVAEAEAEAAALAASLEVERSQREASEAEAATERRLRHGDESVLAAHAEAVAEAERLRAKLRVAATKLREENEGASVQQSALRIADEQEAVRRRAEAERRRLEREAQARKLRDAERGREAAEAALAAEQRGCASAAHEKVTAERRRLERIHADEKRKLEEALNAARRRLAASVAEAESKSEAAADARASAAQATASASVERRAEGLSRRLHAERTARAAAEVRLEVMTAAQACARAEAEPLELLLEDRGRLGVRFHEGDNLAAQDGLVVESVLPSGLVARCAAEAADHGGGEAWRLGPGSILLCVGDVDIAGLARQQALAVLADAMPHRPLRLLFGPGHTQGPDGSWRSPPSVDVVVARRLEKAVEAQAHAEGSLEQEAEERRHAEAALKTARSEQQRAEEEAARVRMRLGSLEQQAEEAEAKSAELELELERQRGLNNRLQDERAAAQEEARVASASLESAESLMREQAAGRAAANQQIQVLSTELDESRVSVAALQAQSTHHEDAAEAVKNAAERAKQAEAMAQAAETESLRRQHEAELRAVSAARDAAENELTAEKSRRQGTEEHLKDAEAQRDEARAAAAVAQRERASADEQALTQRREREAAESMLVAERTRRQQQQQQQQRRTAQPRPVARAIATVAPAQGAATRAVAVRPVAQPSADEKFLAEQRALGLLDSSDEEHASAPAGVSRLPMTGDDGSKSQRQQDGQEESPAITDPAGRMAQLARRADRLVPSTDSPPPPIPPPRDHRAVAAATPLHVPAQSAQADRAAPSHQDSSNESDEDGALGRFVSCQSGPEDSASSQPPAGGESNAEPPPPIPRYTPRTPTLSPSPAAGEAGEAGRVLGTVSMSSTGSTPGGKSACLPARSPVCLAELPHHQACHARALSFSRGVVCGVWRGRFSTALIRHVWSQANGDGQHHAHTQCWQSERIYRRGVASEVLA